MEIKLTSGIRNPDYEHQAWLDITVNGKDRVNAYAGEPEDFSLERDLSFVYQIVPLMREAYEAGKRGEEFIVLEESE